MKRRERGTTVVQSSGRWLLASAAGGIAIFASLVFFGFALDLLPDPVPYLVTALLWGGAAGLIAAQLGWRFPWAIALSVGFAPGLGPGIFAFAAVLLMPDPRARLAAHRRCLRYLELAGGLRALQSAEAAAYLDGIVSATDNQAPARDALQKAKEAAERLKRVSEEILERHQDFAEVPPVLESLNRAWLDCDEVFNAWARAETARMAAAADGISLASDAADVLYRQWEETRKRALAEQERTLRRLRLSPGERAALLANFSEYTSR